MLLEEEEVEVGLLQVGLLHIVELTSSFEVPMPYYIDMKLCKIAEKHLAIQYKYTNTMFYKG